MVPRRAEEIVRSVLRIGARRSRHVRTPTILQMEAVECGAASLAMILAFHGLWIPLEELRLRCGVSRDGTKASNILKGGRHYGLSAKGFRKEPEDLLSLPIPSIIHWNFNHFVVFEGLSGKYACINDPGLGKRRISAEEFSESFTGVVLALEPGPDFTPGGKPPRLFGALAQRLQGSGQGVAIVLLMSLLLLLPGIVTPVFAKVFVDDILIDRLRDWLTPLLLGMAVTALLRASIIWIRAHYLLRLETKLALSMGSRFIWHLLRLPVVFFTQRHAGELVNRITANDDIARLLSSGLATTVLSLGTSALFLIVMVALNASLAAIVIPITLVNVLALRLATRYRATAAQRLMKDRGQLMGATVGIVRSIETIKAAGLEQDAFARWSGFHAKMMATSRDLDRASAVIGVVPALLAGLGNAALLGVGSLQVMAGKISVGDLVAFQVLSASFSEPIGQILGMGTALQEIKSSLASVRDVLAYAPDARFAKPEENRAESPAHTLARLRGAVELRNVTFGYNQQEPPLIAEFHLSVKPGSRVALVGASGSGKSTLGRLISGLYAPWSGAILIDGIPLTEISRNVLANSLAYVDQEVFLFEGSISQNVTLWDHTIEDAALSQALKDAAIFPEVALRPNGQDATVSEAGINFSGGQRQRLEIARALAGDPSILILDEATAALDPVVEREIDDNIRRRGCTCIIIAHRLSTIRDCDEIVMLHEGRVVGRGGHAELIETCTEYRRMIDAQ
jgi:NHLM bacteriocin system ABC transporter peptidase/ATP-binding protein